MLVLLKTTNIMSSHARSLVYDKALWQLVLQILLDDEARMLQIALDAPFCAMLTGILPI